LQWSSIHAALHHALRLSLLDGVSVLIHPLTMRLSIRAKLILIMTIVVAMATFATIWVTQRYVKRFYERNFEDDFKAEVQFFSERQLQRQNELRKRCREWAENQSVIMAVQEGDRKVYGMLKEEILKFFQEEMLSDRGLAAVFPALAARSGSGGPSRPFASANGKRPVPSTPLPTLPPHYLSLLPALEIMDAEGDIIDGGDGRLFSTKGSRVQGRRGESMRSVLKQLVSRVGAEQEIAYRVRESSDGKKALWEYIITPVLDPAKSEPVGAILIGMQAPDLGERGLHAFTSAISDADSRKEREADAASSGFWLNGELHTQTIPKEARAAVAALVAERIAEGHVDAKFAGTDMTVEVAGETRSYHVLHRLLNPGSPFEPASQVCLYPTRAVEEESAQLQARILQIGGISLAGAMLMILLLTRGLVRPIEALVQGTEEIRKGNFHITVPVKSRDEIGQLATSFNEMAQGLKLNQKYQRLLSQVADRMVAQQLISNEAALGGELREVSVLFCDIRGFTTLTSGMPPGEVIALLNEHMSALTTLVHEHCGVVDKFVGDMIMALFGAPSAYGDDAHRAAQCALRMVECRDRLNQHGKWNFHVGIGIATGTVVAGCMGSEERLDYTVLGEKVNLAARLCGAAGEADVWVDETTAEKLGPLAEIEPLGDLSLKGFPASVAAFRLTAVHPADADGTATMTSLTHPLAQSGSPLFAPS
jgi:class 3 adenylate cyclase